MTGGIKAALLFLAIPTAMLLGYDAMVVRPRLPGIEQILADSDAQDASPPAMVRDLIDANAGSPGPHAVRLVLARLNPAPVPQWRAQVRESLWRVLLPLHLGRSRMYGLYAALSYNGNGHGLSSFARREFGKPLDRLSAREAATTVANIHGPGLYLHNPHRLQARAELLLDRASR